MTDGMGGTPRRTSTTPSTAAIPKTSGSAIATSLASRFALPAPISLKRMAPVANKNLRELIEWLAAQDPNKVVEHGFGEPHSDRGDYSNLAFKPEATARIGDMLIFARSALGRTFTGYKGGEFLMNEYVDVLVGSWGYCGENITDTHLRYWASQPSRAAA